jgi:hypothetical protein
MDTEEGAKQKNLAMAKKKFNMDPKKVRLQGTGTCGSRWALGTGRYLRINIICNATIIVADPDGSVLI